MGEAAVARAEGGDADDHAAVLEAGRKLFAQPCRFTAAAVSIEQVPASVLPEIAFAGRSNVGKSTLINCLTGRQMLARTSHTPGRTRQINFFNLAERLMLVDLPGYGYAAAPRHQVAAWTKLVEAYLCGRAPLRRVLLLIDARHGIKENDRRVMNMLDRAAVSYQVLLTKSDKASLDGREHLLARLPLELAQHTAAHPEVIATSAWTGAGLEVLRAQLVRLAAWQADPAKPGR